VNLFDHLDAAVRASLDDLAETVRARSGERIIRRGERDGDLFRVISGRLEVVDGRSRPELVLGVLGPGAVVGEMAFVAGSARSADVRAGSDTVLLRWPRSTLNTWLGDDAAASANFHRAVSLVLAERLERLNREAASGSFVDRSAAVSADDASRVRRLAESLKLAFIDIENQLVPGRELDHRRELGTALGAFIGQGENLFKALQPEARIGAGKLLSRELHPYLARSRFAELARRQDEASRAPLLGHLLVAAPEGTDPLGRLLDAILLELPTARGLRRRMEATADHLEALAPSLPDGSLKLGVVGVGSGALVAALGQVYGRRAAELTCVDNDRRALAFLQSGTEGHTSKLKLRLQHEDLAALFRGRSETWIDAHDVVVLRGVVDHLPDRVVGASGPVLKKLLRPGGHLVVSVLSPGADSFFFEHLLGWPTVRRDPVVFVEVLKSLGFRDVSVAWSKAPAHVVTARAPA